MKPSEEFKLFLRRFSNALRSGGLVPRKWAGEVLAGLDERSARMAVKSLRHAVDGTYDSAEVRRLTNDALRQANFAVTGDVMELLKDVDAALKLPARVAKPARGIRGRNKS
jgi:hypothetical protein